MAIFYSTVAFLRREDCVLSKSSNPACIASYNSRILTCVGISILSISGLFSRPRVYQPEVVNLELSKDANQPIMIRHWVTWQNRTKPCEHPVDEGGCEMVTKISFDHILRNFEEVSDRKSSWGDVVDKIPEDLIENYQRCVIIWGRFGASTILHRRFLPRAHFMNKLQTRSRSLEYSIYPLCHGCRGRFSAVIGRGQTAAQFVYGKLFDSIWVHLWRL